MSRSVLTAANWKMHKTIPQALRFVKAFTALAEGETPKAYLAVPATALYAVAQACEGTSLVVGAQNMHAAEQGAYTGEVSAEMIRDAGGRFVILGHSERRQYFGESDALVREKVERALQTGLKALVCVGESQEERDQGRTEQVLEQQISTCLRGLSASQLGDVILAYEPLWAIGTGKTATPEMAQETHHFCRRLIARLWNSSIAETLRIQYGGSVKPANAASLLAQEDIDGFLVGGASLEAESFYPIVTCQQTKKEML